jgi:hypothetical protein
MHLHLLQTSISTSVGDPKKKKKATKQEEERIDLLTYSLLTPVFELGHKRQLSAVIFKLYYYHVVSI